MNTSLVINTERWQPPKTKKLKDKSVSIGFYTQLTFKGTKYMCSGVSHIWLRYGLLGKFYLVVAIFIYYVLLYHPVEDVITYIS